MLTASAKRPHGILRWGKDGSVFLPFIGNILPPRAAFLPLALILVLAAACGGAPGEAVSRSCGGLEDVDDRAGLISRHEAEELATEWLAMSAPEVSATEIEGVWATCLTTLRSYDVDLLEGTASSSPLLPPPDTPVWVVEVKGISRPAGISTRGANESYRYAIQVINAKTAEAIAGSRRWEPLLEPSP